MPDFPIFSGEPPLSVISTFDPRICAAADCHQTQHTSAASSFAYPTANLAILFPVQIPVPVTVTKMAVYNGATVSGNVDVGIYDINLNRLVSIGGVAQAGVSAPQIFDIADTALDLGTYYLAIVADNAVATFMEIGTSLEVLTAMGCLQMATAYPLPATVTGVAITHNLQYLVAALASGVII